jgi:hypothetical protein
MEYFVFLWYYLPRGEVKLMDKNEVALKITLALIEKGVFKTDSETNTSIGKSFAELFNSIKVNLVSENSKN